MVTFVATAFEEKYDAHVFIGSLLCQKNPNWRAIIYANGHNQYISSLIGNIPDERITYRFSMENTGYWGCFNRIKALEEVNTEYVVQSSIQDYYLPNAVGEILSDNEDLIFWNSLHNHFDWELLNTKLKISHIDWGCFAIKTEIAKRVGIKKATESYSDGQFVEDCLLLSPTLRKIHKTLTIHN